MSYDRLSFLKSQYSRDKTMCSEIDLGLKHQEMKAVTKC